MSKEEVWVRVYAAVAVRSSVLAAEAADIAVEKFEERRKAGKFWENPRG